MNPQDLQNELDSLKNQYVHELDSLQDRIVEARKKIAGDRFSNHDPFNMSADCQNLAVLAGKIEQTVNVIRWMDGK